MREYIDIVKTYLMEASPPQGSRTITRPGTSTQINVTPSISQPPATSYGSDVDPMGSTTQSPNQVRMRAGLPQKASDMMHDFLSREHPQDEISDEEAAKRAGRVNTSFTEELPRNPENLPAVVTHELMAHSDKKYADTWEPTWTMVKHLPGYMANAIRALGRSIFRQFTNIPIEDIQVMASPMVNTDYDMDRMIAFIVKNGIKDDTARLDFGQTIPGYSANVALFRMAGYEFLVVQDFAGKYIYGWPGGRGVHINNQSGNQLRLK